MTSKTVFQLNQDGLLVGETMADESPRVPGAFLIPYGCVEVVPPAHVDGKQRQFANGAWAYIDIPLPEPVPEVVPPTLSELKEKKNAAINAARLTANQTAFTFQGKAIACDPLSRGDIDGVANHIALFGTFPPEFPGGWKAADNSTIPMPSIDVFKSFYQAMTAQGSANFNHAQALKAQLFDADTDTPEEIAAIVWQS